MQKLRGLILTHQCSGLGQVPRNPRVGSCPLVGELGASANLFIDISTS